MAKKQKKSAMGRTRRYAGRIVAAIPVVVPGVVAAVASVATARELQRQSECGGGYSTAGSDDYTTSSSNGHASSSNGRTRRSSSKTRKSGQKATATA
jgi:hypothetical protein